MLTFLVFSHTKTRMQIAYHIMKRYTSLLVLFLFSLITAVAQTMSDAQVIEFVKQRHSNGASQTSIVAELLEKGATHEQLLRLKRLTEGNSASNAATSTSQQDIDRSRVNNGEQYDDDPAANYNDEKKDLGKKKVGNNNYNENLQSEKTKEENSTSEIFGHDIFRTKMLSFEPNMSIAVPETYVLGAGDEVIIDVYGDSQRSDKLKVAPDGTVTMAYAGPITVAGRTLQQVRSTISGRLRPYYSGSNIKVTIGQTRAITINVMGEVQTPGSYTLSAFASVFHALYHAGGVNDIGTLREIKICRGGRVVSTVDVYDYILNGRLTGNILLEDGDVILVDTYKHLVMVKGEVKRPMYYEIKGGETLGTLLGYAGGFKGGAYTDVVTIERTRNTEAYVFTPKEKDFDSFLLADGDVVTVALTETHYVNMAEIKGAVYRPGRYQIGDSMRTVRSLIEQAGGLREEALRTRAIVLRMNPDRTRTAITIDLDGIMSGTSPDVTLNNEDEISISSRERELADMTLDIEGEVYQPGTYDYATNMTVEDLITIAGGLKLSASILNIEVSRRIVNPQGAEDLPQRAEIYNVNIKDGLQISEQSSFRLKPYDKVYVRKSPSYSEQKSVWVGGEVLFEGFYTLESQTERLSDIVKRTGGFTTKASIRDARLKRRMNETELLRRTKLMQRAEAVSDSINMASLDLNETYYVGIDLNEAIEHPGGSADLVLRDGDELIIPQLENTVKINGEVLYPNTITYNEGKSLSYYINQAGGYTKEAQKRQAYIIYNNGHVSRAKSGQVQPGCEIVVPTKKHKENTKTVATTLSVTTTIATIAAVLVSALK